MRQATTIRLRGLIRPSVRFAGVRSRFVNDSAGLMVVTNVIVMLSHATAPHDLAAVLGGRRYSPDIHAPSGYG
jgi:hypothetical protein